MGSKGVFIFYAFSNVDVHILVSILSGNSGIFSYLNVFKKTSESKKIS